MNGVELQSSIFLVFTTDVAAQQKIANYILTVLLLLWFRDARNGPARYFCVM